MIKTYTRPFLPDERAEIGRKLADVPRPYRDLVQEGVQATSCLVPTLLLFLLVWAIVSSDWPVLLIGILGIPLGLLAFLFALVVWSLIISIPTSFRRQLVYRHYVLSTHPALNRLLDEDQAHVTRVETEYVIEFGLEEAGVTACLCALPEGKTYYFEYASFPKGLWPNTCFEIVKGHVDTQTVWEYTRGTGDELDDSQHIRHPWRYTAYTEFDKRQEGDAPFPAGLYEESPQMLLRRLIGEQSAP